MSATQEAGIPTSIQTTEQEQAVVAAKQQIAEKQRLHSNFGRQLNAAKTQLEAARAAFAADPNVEETLDQLEQAERYFHRVSVLHEEAGDAIAAAEELHAGSVQAVKAERARAAAVEAAALRVDLDAMRSRVVERFQAIVSDVRSSLHDPRIRSFAGDIEQEIAVSCEPVLGRNDAWRVLSAVFAAARNSK